MIRRGELESARVQSLVEVVWDLLAILKRDGGFRTMNQMKTIRGARALLAECGAASSGEDA